MLFPGVKVPLSLEPMLVFRERELAEEALFLNRDRNGREVEYLSYTTGQPERDRAMAPALAALELPQKFVPALMRVTVEQRGIHSPDS